MQIMIEIDEATGAVSVDGSPVESIEEVCEMLRQMAGQGEEMEQGEEMSEEDAMQESFRAPGPML